MWTTVGTCAECTLTVQVEVLTNYVCTYNVIHTHVQYMLVLGREQWMSSSTTVHTMNINCILVTMYINTTIMLV